MLSFAIVIPNYNQSHFLSTALESLRNQKVSLQIAVVDGGSEDDFEKVINKYSNLITYVRSHPDEGQSAAINEGTWEIDGDIVSWLNADDYLFPGALTHVQKVFQEFPDVDVVYGDAIHVTPGGQFLSYFPPIQPHDRRDLVRNDYICQPACFYRREAFMEVSGVDPQLFYTMDWDLWCRFADKGKTFKYIPKVLAAVRYYPETKTLSGGRKRFKEIYNIEKRYGDRPLKIAWIGAFWYGLTLKKHKTFSEWIFFLILNSSRKIKNTIANHRTLKAKNTNLYGFRRDEPVIEGKCVIHFPWYNKPWKVLQMTISPRKLSGGIEIQVNNRECKTEKMASGKIIAYLQKPAPNYSVISISHIENKNWTLNYLEVN